MLLTNETHVAKVKASDIIAEYSNILWVRESRWE
jgi:hypothetical protein